MYVIVSHLTFLYIQTYYKYTCRNWVNVNKYLFKVNQLKVVGGLLPTQKSATSNAFHLSVTVGFQEYKNMLQFCLLMYIH